MDFDSLQRKDLQFFCKRNQIPANMTNVAMADALKSLEIVEGMDEYMSQSPPFMNMASGARRKTAKDENETSELVTRSCYVKSKSSLAQENTNANINVNVSKTPAARRAQASESVQRKVYSTRRAVRLLEESMADLSLKTKESLNVPSKKNEDSQQGSKVLSKSDESLEEPEEAQVVSVSVRDLNDSLEKEWKNDQDLGDVTFSDANPSEQQQMNDIVVDHAAFTSSTNIVACNKESEELVSSEESEPEEEETDEWSDYDIRDMVVESEEAAHVADKKSPASSLEETITVLSSFEAESNKSAVKLALAAENDNKNKENVVEMNGEGKSEAIDAKEKKKKKMLDEESLNNVSMRQLMKMAKELAAIKSKQQQHKVCLE